MKFLLDNGLPRSAVEHLARLTHIAEHVGAIGMATATDGQILDRARSTGAVVVTLDADFHSLLALSGATRPSVIRIRVEGLKGAPMAQLIDRVVRQMNDEIAAGAAISVNAKRISSRRLPLL